MAQSEYGVELTLLKPVGRFGHVFKASPGLRVTRSFSDTDKALQKRAVVGIHHFNARQDTVNVGWYAGRNPLTNAFDNDVFSGSQEIHNLTLYVSLGGQFMYRPFRESFLRPYGIVELHGIVGIIDREINSLREQLGESGGDVGIALGGGGGLEYLTDGAFTFYLNVIRTYNYTNLQGGFVYWNTSLGATYVF